MKSNLKLFSFVFALFLFSANSFAQVTTASISGSVHDQSAASLPSATVKATHTPTGTVYYVSTLNNGRFNISGMRTGGPYVIEISFVGYNTEVLTGVNLTLGEEASFNVVLREDNIMLSEVVVVGDKNSAISASRTGAQEVITRDKMERLPSMNRSINDFTKLTPMSSGNNFAGTSYRFNNVTVDGASFNNSFGLSSSLGAAGVQPISIESIEQIQVMIAPFDVRNGAFTGAGINSVTKSGTNSWQGSAYYYMKHPNLQGIKQKDVTVTRPQFSNNQFGLTIGGPIIKNKLFFFLNAEMDRQSQPINWQARENTGSESGNNGISYADKQTLGELKGFLKEKFGYDPGSYEVKNTPTYADKITARIDWNIDSKNSLSFKYFYLKSYNTNSPSGSGLNPLKGARAASATSIPFSSSYYRTNNNFNIFMADLNTTISSTISNTLKVGYSRLRDFREMDGGFFPEVNIGDGDASPTNMTTFGTEANSYNCRLDSDIFQIQDNFLWTIGNHQLTFGTQSDYRTFLNGYARNFAGSYQYKSLQDFYTDANNYLDWRAANPNAPLSEAPTTNAFNYLQAVNMTGGDFPYAKVNVLSLGFYVQDKWSVTDNLNLTLGLRVDTPIFMNDIDRNETLSGLTFQGGRTVDTSKLPKTTPMFSPRLGFNWDALGNKTLQLRGGTGLFSGTPPYVWIYNQSGNNGLLFANNPNKPAFSGTVEIPKPASGVLPAAQIAITDNNLKYPQLWKTNFAIDYKFLGGWVATAEILYNKDVNNLMHKNINLPNYDDENLVKTMGGADNRPYFVPNNFSKGRPVLNGPSVINPEALDVILLTNTSKGYSLYTTFQLQRSFNEGALKGLYLNGSYTFGHSKSVTDGSSSVANSAWKYRPAIDPNGEELSYSGGSFPQRVLAQAAYKIEYAKSMSSSVGFIYQMYMPFRYSYTYASAVSGYDVNGDGAFENDLMFVPASADQISIKPGAGDTRSKEQIWAEIDAFIEQDSYLKSRRGKYAERNGAMVPYVHQIDFNFTQDFFLQMKNGQRNTLRLSFDIQNLGNLLNKNWGVQKTTILGYANSPQYQFLSMTEAPSSANNWTPSFTMPLQKIDGQNQVLTKTFQDLISDVSRWQIQFGVKYMFN